MQTIQDTTTLNNGVAMPWFGLGVYQSEAGAEVENAVSWALAAGYRSIDTATLYRNERGVGRAVRASGVPREEVFITTKVWNSDQGYDQTLRAFDTSLQELDMDYVDLYLIHWPIRSKYKDTWRALEKIYAEGRARAIGVSNFAVRQLTDLLESANVVPAVNQVEFHPFLQQRELQAFCQDFDIRLEAWAPLMKGRVLRVPELITIGEKYGKNAVQVSLRWMLQLGIITIPKSARRERIIANADVFDFELTAAEMATINGLDQHERLGTDPNSL